MHKTQPRFGQTIEWSDLSGGTHRVTVDDCDTPAQAVTEAVRFARACGWTPPRWWQWWRWNDTRLKNTGA